jgi:multicomponent Na+:H+ antiporter subunit E
MKVLFLNLLLGIVWVLLTGVFSPLNFLVGLVAGYIVLWISQPALVPTGYFRKVPRALAFLGFFLWELLLSNLRVAYDVVTPTHYMKPGVVGIPLDAKSDMEITLLANFISLTPGTLSLDVSTNRRMLYVHSMYISDIDDFRHHVKEFERRLLEVLR